MSRPDGAVILEQYFREHSEGLISAYLFGSHASGRQHRESDVDVAVLFDRAAIPTSAGFTIRFFRTRAERRRSAERIPNP